VVQTDPDNVDTPSAPAPGVPVPEASNEVVPAPERVKDWRSNIFFFWLSIVGTFGTLLGVGLSVYFYQASKIKPLLTFSIHPLRTELQRPDFDKELGFIYKGKPVESESITSIQMSIWNAGTRSIRDSDVLEPFRLMLPDGAAILSARVKKTTRPICGFEILDNQADYKSGTCHLKWRILEPGDGAVLQIIYAGSSRRDPKLEGAVEGQRDGIVVEQYNLNVSRTAIQDSVPMSRAGPIFGLMLVAGLLFFIALRSHAKTEAAMQLAKEKAAAAKHLAELQKRRVPVSPLFGYSLPSRLFAFCVLLHCFSQADVMGRHSAGSLSRTDPGHARGLFDTTYNFSRNFAQSRMSFGRAALFVA